MYQKRFGLFKEFQYFTKTKILLFLLFIGIYTLFINIWSLTKFNSLPKLNFIQFNELKQIHHYQMNKCSIPYMNLWPNHFHNINKTKINLPKCKQTTLFKLYNLSNHIISIHDYLSFHLGKLTIHHYHHSNNTLRLNSSLVTCSLFPIKRLNDYQSIYLNVIEQIDDGYQSSWPMFMVICQPKQNIFLLQSNFNSNYYKLDQIERLFICGSYYTNKKQKKSIWPVTKRKQKKLMYNILLLGIDSISRLSAYRYLTKTIQFLHNINESTIIMNLYNVIGDGTTVNLLGLLTGQLETELPESRKSHLNNIRLNQYDNYTILDNYPWIWKEYSDYGNYVTHYIEDTPKWGTFQHRLCGFGSMNNPTTSYGRPCLIAASQEENYSGKILGCTMSRYTHKVLLESLTEFFETYSDRPRFSLTFLSELIHENPAYAKLIDEDLSKLIQRIYYEDLMFNSGNMKASSSSRYPFANTLVILFSDHGPRMGDARLSVQGKLEERLPFMSIIAPKMFQEKWSNQWANMKNNQNRLITLFDIHATLRDLLINQLKYNNNNNSNNNNNDNNSNNNNNSIKTINQLYMNWKMNPSHGLSLFNQIPLNRNCDDAYISSHWCVCLNWIKLENNNELIIKCTNVIINKINQIIIKYKSNLTKNGQCSMIKLHQIESVEQAILPQDMVRFIRSQDEDGRIPMFEEQYSSTWSLLDWIKQFNIFNSNNNNNNIFNYDSNHESILLRIHIIVQPEYAHFEATVKVNITQHSLNHFHVMDISRIDVYEQHNWCLSDNEWAETKQYCICTKYT
uniref:Sulfatase domain-containing protein n=1 Tax=Schistosoma mansoni TaxID=6183 RepID=A0A3Q0KNY2_SCHMA